MRTMRPLAMAGLAALALALGPAPASAQRSRSAVGFQAGYSSAQFNAPDIDGSLTRREGAYVGVYYRRHLLTWLTLQPELDFTIKGGEVPLGTTSGAFDAVTLDLGVLEIPVLFKVAPSYKKGGFRPLVFGGASLGLEVGCNRTFVGPEIVRTVECSATDSLTIGDETVQVGTLGIPSPDVSWIVGAGVQWEANDISLGLEARYQRGLRQLLDIDTPVHTELWAILLALTI